MKMKTTMKAIALAVSLGAGVSAFADSLSLSVTPTQASSLITFAALNDTTVAIGASSGSNLAATVVGTPAAGNYSFLVTYAGGTVNTGPSASAANGIVLKNLSTSGAVVSNASFQDASNAPIAITRHTGVSDSVCTVATNAISFTATSGSGNACLVDFGTSFDITTIDHMVVGYSVSNAATPLTAYTQTVTYYVENTPA